TYIITREKPVMKMYKDCSDMELLDFMKSGDSAAFTEIFDRYNGLLYIHAFKRLQDREECRDLVQELLTTLWLKRDSIQLTTTLSGYLYMAVRNRIFNLLAKKKLTKEYCQEIQQWDMSGNFSSDHLVRLNQLTALIDQEIASLPKRTREIFELSR